MPFTRNQQLGRGFVLLAIIAYIGLTSAAPRTNASNPYHLSLPLIVTLSLTIIGLLLLAWWFGFYAWLELDRYIKLLPQEEGRGTFGKMAKGVGLLVSGLILSSLISALKPFFGANVGLAELFTQLNYYTILIFPFLGFMWLRIGSLHLAVAAQAVMPLRSKLVTVGPPVLLLASFYVYLVATNSDPTAVASMGPLGFLVLPINIFLVVGSWVWGLLAALNIERATHLGEGARLAAPLARLYNGILLMTGGFIILDALMSMGAARLRELPVSMVAFLIYGFIGVVAISFWMVGKSAHELIVAAPPKAKTGGK